MHFSARTRASASVCVCVCVCLCMCRMHVFIKYLKRFVTPKRIKPIGLDTDEWEHLKVFGSVSPPIHSTA